MSKTRITISLDTYADADLLAWLEQQGPGARSAAVRATLRAGLGLVDREPTIRDVLAAIEDLKAHGLRVALGDEQPAREPADVAARLDGLGL